MPPLSLLVVDDQPFFRGAIRAMFEDGHDDGSPDADPFSVVGEAADGEQAVDLASSLRPDVVLMDVRLPGIDGPQATRLILAHDASVSVVLMSTARRGDLAADLLECGAVGFLAKETLEPASLRRLLKR
jgi:DNA-binding NarL/FixJ family response regulator